MEGVGLAFRDSQKQAFLDSEPSWTVRLGDGWKGIKFLGKGSFGIVGLWEYQGDPTKAPAVTKVVVKQSADEPMDDMNIVWGGKSAMDEGRILAVLSKLNSNHIIRQYGGNRRGDQFLEMGQVVRIYLEFCPGGDLDQLVSGFHQPPNPLLHELDLWKIFKCLAFGVAVLDRGTENSKEPAWRGYSPHRPELCHFDIKPDNSK
jgi:serine/threonine protein kinase